MSVQTCIIQQCKEDAEFALSGDLFLIMLRLFFVKMRQEVTLYYFMIGYQK